jgi:2'-5' RNA ligase
MTATVRQRLFFAARPDDDVCGELARIARAHLAPGNGRLIAASNLHLTLEFLGAVGAGVRDCAARVAQSVSAPAFELEFQRLGFWSRPRILWTAPESTPDALAGLVSTLRKALVACGHRPEARPFRAHVTLARKVRGPLEQATHAPVRWSVSEFHLMVSETLPEGARYRSLGCWPLG